MLNKTNKLKSSKMTEQEKLDLIITINEFPSSQWSKIRKQRILSQYKKDKEFQQEIIQAFIKKQLQETEADPLEDKVFDQNGICLASRDWECHARNCSYQPFRANCAQLKIEVSKADSAKLIRCKKYACLKHYLVPGKGTDYCHHYFKVNKKLPFGAMLNIQLSKEVLKLSLQQPQQSTNGATNLAPKQITSAAKNLEVDLQPSTNKNDRELDETVLPLKNVRTYEQEQTVANFDGGPRKKAKLQHEHQLAPLSSHNSDNSLDSVPQLQEIVAQKESTVPRVVSQGTQTDQANESAL